VGKESLKIVFLISGDFIIENGLIRLIDNKSFCAIMEDGVLTVSDVKIGLSDLISRNKNISMIENNTNVSECIEIVPQSDVLYKSKNNKDIYFNGELLLKNSQQEEPIAKIESSWNKVQEYNIGKYYIDTILISGDSKVSAKHLQLRDNFNIKMNGNGGLICKSFLKNKKTIIKNYGSGDISVYGLVSSVLKVKINGFGDIRLYNSVGTLMEANINGSGDIFANTCNFKKTRKKINGSGKISGF